MAQGRVKEAIPYYLNALQINPDYVNARYNIGIAYFNNGNTPAAVKNFKEALRLNPNADYIRAALEKIEGKK
jgi:tetratricopeptide (TPR) repeat protein